MQRPKETSRLKYPPQGHVLRYARLAVDAANVGQVEGLMPAFDDMCDAGRSIRLGGMALLVDYVAGVMALQTVQPDWTVTHDMAIHLKQPVPAEGELEATCRLVRAGKNNVISETSIVSPTSGEAARAFVTFTRLPRRDGMLQSKSGAISNLADPIDEERPRVPLDEAVGFRLSEPAVSDHPSVAFDHEPFVHNSVKAIQGGVVALSLERAASHAAETELGCACRTVDLHLHYLALGKTGPFHARAEVLRRSEASVTSRVALHDTGNDDRLLALGVATADAI